MRYMVVERFREGAGPVYERASHTGRMLPPGLRYLDSWVDQRLEKCFQLMETEDPRLFDEWVAHWSDLVVFEEITLVISSAEAASRIIGGDRI